MARNISHDRVEVAKHMTSLHSQDLDAMVGEPAITDCVAALRILRA